MTRVDGREEGNEGEERRTIRMEHMEGGEVFEEEYQALRKIDQDRRHGAAR